MAIRVEINFDLDGRNIRHAIAIAEDDLGHDLLGSPEHLQALSDYYFRPAMRKLLKAWKEARRDGCAQDK